MELKPLKSLRRVSLTKAFSVSLVHTAISLVKTLPSVNELTLRWLDKRFAGNIRQTGLYTVLVDPSTHRRILHADEKGFSHVMSIGAMGGVDPSFQIRTMTRHKLKLPELTMQ
jgi:hypothetical protein